MATTNFSQWNNAAINQDTDSQYAADSLRIGGAPTGGILPSPTFNKFAYQASTFIAAFGQMLANKGFNTSDADINVLEAVLANVLTTADQATALQFVPYSPTPSLNAANVAAFYMPLNGNSAIQSLSNCTAGQKITMIYIQDGTGGRVVTFPGNFFQATTPDPSPGAVSIQEFIYDPYEGQLYAAGPLTNWNKIFVNNVQTSTLQASGAITAASASISGSLSTGGNANLGSLEIGGAAPSGQVLTGNGTTYVPQPLPTLGASQADVTGSRSLNVTYQNTSGKVVYVSGAATTSGSSTGSVTCASGPSSPSTIVYANESTATVAGGTAGFAFVVPPNYFYSVSGAGAVSGLAHWVETTIS